MTNTSFSPRMEEVLKRALYELAEEENKEVDKILPFHKHTFSEGFERKMQRLIRAQSKSYWRYVNTVGKRVAIIILSFLIVSTTTVFGVESLRNMVYEFFVDVFEEYSVFGFSKGELSQYGDLNEFISLPQNSHFPEEIEQKYTPEYIPKGFKLISEEEPLNCFRTVLYKDDRNDEIFFNQYVRGASISGDTEDTEIYEVKVNGGTALYYENKAYGTLIWKDFNYVYRLCGNLSKNELLKMAESTKLVG